MIENMIICGDWIEVLKGLPSSIFHCCVTSPAYWGQRDYGWGGDGSCYDPIKKADVHQGYKQINSYLEACTKCGRKRPLFGLEKTPEEYIEKLVESFREVRRVLRPDGVLWMNYGDKYSTGGRQGGQSGNMNSGAVVGGYNRNKVAGDLVDGNLLMLPDRVALALQADGWILRDDVIWAKAISFNDRYSGSTMPESVNGTRWERCRVKVEKENKETRTEAEKLSGFRAHSGYEIKDSAKYKDCPGCVKCEKNPAVCPMCMGSGKALIDGKDVGVCLTCDGSGIFGGYVLRRGSWRCTKAHEHLFQLTKTNQYFCDMEAVREDSCTESIERARRGISVNHKNIDGAPGQTPHSMAQPRSNDPNRDVSGGRNLRNVWTINPRGYKQAHYATYPEALVEPCIKVSTSKKGVCPKCGCQWARIVDKQTVKRERPNDRTDRHNQGNGVNSCGNTVAGVETTTLGWKATCDCGICETEPALVLDPFMGSGTTAVVAGKLGRNYFGCEINPEYKAKHIDVRTREVETGVPIDESLAGQKGLFE